MNRTPGTALLAAALLALTTAPAALAQAQNKDAAEAISRVREMNRDRCALSRLTERYADYNQTGFLAFQRWDGNLVDAGTNPLKFLAQSAT